MGGFLDVLNDLVHPVDIFSHCYQRWALSIFIQNTVVLIDDFTVLFDLHSESFLEVVPIRIVIVNVHELAISLDHLLHFFDAIFTLVYLWAKILFR